MKKLIIAASLAATALSAQAESVTPQATAVTVNQGVITQKLAELGLKAKKITATPINDLQQVITDKGVFYASADGRYLVQGTMIDLDKRENLTETALADVRLEGIHEYEDSMIVYKAEEEKGKITVFTDISCGYCRKLHRELDELLESGITVRYLAFPRGGLRGTAYADLMNVWCAANPQEALTDAKAGDSTEPVQGCNAPVAEHYQLGQSFGISGTPAIVLEDGSMIPGYQPAAALSARIEQINSDKS